CPEALGAAPARLGLAPNLRVSSHRRALTRRTHQDADPARRGSGPRASPHRDRSCGSSVCRQVGSMPGTGGPNVCSLDDRSSCPRTSPSRLTPLEVRAIEDMVTSPDYRHARPARSPRCPATRQGLGLTLNLVPARPAKRLALARLRVHPVVSEN